MKGKKRIIFDCDPGVDDALALVLALNSGQVELAGITTVSGNVSVNQTTLNACRLLDYLGQDIPVSRGASRPLKTRPSHAARVHGSDGLGDSSLLPRGSTRRPEREGAAGFIARSVESGTKTIVATGPLTNIALAFRGSPKAMRGVEELIIMGGAIRVPGNVDSVSEFNFYADPDAADYVVQKTTVPKVLVPLDATHRVILAPADLDQIRDSQSGKLVKSVVAKYQGEYISSGLPGSPLHDPLAMGYCIDRSFLELQPMQLRVETSGIYTRGMCVPEERTKIHRRPNIKVALGVDSERFLDYFKGTVSR